MMQSEPREDDPSINIVTQSGVATEEDKAKGKKLVAYTWVRKT